MNNRCLVGSSSNSHHFEWHTLPGAFWSDLKCQDFFIVAVAFVNYEMFTGLCNVAINQFEFPNHIEELVIETESSQRLTSKWEQMRANEDNEHNWVQMNTNVDKVVERKKLWDISLLVTLVMFRLSKKWKPKGQWLEASSQVSCNLTQAAGQSNC